MSVDALSRTFAALAHPARRAILQRLANGDATVKELAAPFAMSAPAISRHLRVLEQAGLIARRRDAQRRPCHLEPAPLQDVVEWAREYRRSWTSGDGDLDIWLQHLRSRSARR